MSFLMHKFRESKADLDQFAEVYCDQQGITADSSLNESAQKSAKMKHFCEFIYNQCKPFQQQELVDAQERIRELEHQLVQAQKSDLLSRRQNDLLLKIPRRITKNGVCHSLLLRLKSR